MTVICVPQTSSITETSPSDCLVSYLGHSSGESYPSAEMQSVYSVNEVDWARHEKEKFKMKSTLKDKHSKY